MYDYQETKTCRPGHEYDAISVERGYAAYLYGRLARVYRDESDRPVEQQINFKRFLTEREADVLFRDPRVKSVEYTDVGTPTYWYPTPWRENATSVSGLIDKMIPEEIARVNNEELNDVIGTTWEASVRTQLKDLETRNGFRLGWIRVVMKPSDMVSFWLEHQDIVRFVQAMENKLQMRQRPFRPDIEVKW